MGKRQKHVGFILVLLAHNLMSMSVHANAISDHGIFLSPESCFALNGKQQCETPVSIEWKTKKTGSYCLFRSDNKIPLKCWNNSDHGKQSYLILTEQDVQFELRDTKTDLSMFKAKLKLFKQVKKLKLKRRNPWSFY